MSDTLNLVLQLGAIVLGSGILWKLNEATKETARWRGTVDARLEGHDETLDRHETSISDLQRFKGVRR